MTDNLQYRLYNADIDPPVDAWPKISGQLDRIAQEHLTQKLQEAALEPPANAWQNILATLEESNQPAAVVPINRSRRNWTWAAAAAAVIIVTGLLYFKPASTDTDETAATGKSEQEQNTVVVPPAARNTDQGSVTNVAQRPTVAISTVSGRNPVRIFAFANSSARVRHAHVSGNSTDEEILESLRVEEAIDQSASLQPDAYISPKEYLTVAAPNGQPAKISAKLTDAVNFVFNNEPVQSIDMAIRSISWQQKFRNWSNKLMNSAAFIPAGTNFLDIVELEELLKE